MPQNPPDTEPDYGIYKTLLESTRAIPWKIDWKTMQFAYIGPQIEPLLGWPQGSWLTVEDWADRMHPEDRERVVNFCVSQSECGIDHEADYRALTANGDYVWIRDVVHVVRDQAGNVEALVGFMFDISERKRNEQALEALQKKLEALSYQDGLTGVANRRMFDQVMEESWNHAIRHHQPLSLLIVDLDYFKQYNDHYGHLQGDESLRRVGRVLSEAAARARDFVARFGGEEFVVVLPETDREAAGKVAERCRQLVFREQIPHEASPVSQLLTVSIGLGTCTPSRGDDLQAFIASVDQQLYAAKGTGRNRVA